MFLTKSRYCTRSTLSHFLRSQKPLYRVEKLRPQVSILWLLHLPISLSLHLSVSTGPVSLRSTNNYFLIPTLTSSSQISWPLMIGPICCTETSVSNYHRTLCNIPEERRSHLLRGGSLKPPIIFVYVFKLILQSKAVRLNCGCIFNLC
jgi:hypothetical protein